MQKLCHAKHGAVFLNPDWDDVFLLSVRGMRALLASVHVLCSTQDIVVAIGVRLSAFAEAERLPILWRTVSLHLLVRMVLGLRSAKRTGRYLRCQQTYSRSRIGIRPVRLFLKARGMGGVMQFVGLVTRFHRSET